MSEMPDIGAGAPKPSDRAGPLGHVVATLLRLGVVLSLLLILGGTLLTLTRRADDAASREAMARLTTHAEDSARKHEDTWESLFASRGRGLTVAGLVLLILTPVARVMVCHVAFVAARDRRFAAMTALVLAGLLISFLLGKAG